MFYLSDIWTEYLEGRAPIEEVIEEYRKQIVFIMIPSKPRLSWQHLLGGPV